MLKLGMSRRVGIAVQLVAVWFMGSLMVPAAYQWIVILWFLEWLGPVHSAGLIVLPIMYTYLLLVVNVTRDVSRLGASWPGRSLWAASVLVLGTAGWWLGWRITDAAGLGISRQLLLVFLVGGVPFLLAAGLLLRGWAVPGVAVGLTLVLMAAGLYAVRQSGPDEVTERLTAYPYLNRDTIYVVDIPGYHPIGQPYGDHLGNEDFAPDDESLIPPERYIEVLAYGPDQLGPPDGLCGRVADNSVLQVLTDCTVEPDGSVFHEGEAEHGYQVQVGDVSVVVLGTAAVDRGLLHHMATTMHLATAAELGGTQQNGWYYAGDAPGYTGQAGGTGMRYELTNHASGLQGVSIFVRGQRYDLAQDCFQNVCEPDGDNLTYVRHDDGRHGYVIRHGDVEVFVEGGSLVDRDLLRRTALAARPATDDEIVRGLEPPRPTGFIGGLRRWLRDHT